MTATLIPTAEDQQIAEQLALAKALREKGMTGTGGAGYNGGKVYMVGNQGGNIANALGGAAMQYLGQRDRAALDATRQQQEADWLAKRPSATTDYAPEGPTETGGNLPVVALPKSAAQRAQEGADWAMQGQGVHTPLAQTMAQFGMQHALTAPEKQADREMTLLAQREALAQRLADKAEQRTWQEKQDALYKRTLADAIALKSTPTINISTGGGGAGAGPFAGAASQIGVDANDPTRAVWRIGKTGQIFSYDENGQPVTHSGGIAPKPGVEKASSEAERNSAGYLGRMEAAEKGIGTAPALDLYKQKGLELAPSAMNYLLTESEQKSQQQKMDWVRAKLRKESGAVIGEKEMADEIRTYFPMPGDKSDVLKSKAQSRAQAEAQMRIGAGKVKSVIAPSVLPNTAIAADDALLKKYGIK